MREEALNVYMEVATLTGNPSALHRMGQRVKARLEAAREELATAVGAHPSEVIFTGSGSEANTLAVLGSWSAGRDAGRGRCLVSAIEHPSVAEALTRGAEALPVTSGGVIDVDQARRLITPDTAVVSVMTINNETGIPQPVSEVAHAASAVGAPLHTDAVQALGHVEVDFARSEARFMSLSAHKVAGPVGIGALLARRDAPLRPVGLGGGQERAVRSGTVPVALAAAFARAASLAVDELADESIRLRGLHRRVARCVLAVGGQINSVEDGAPHIVNATFSGVRAGDLLVMLDQYGVHASVGSACKAGVHQPSEVLLAMGRSLDEAAQSLRFSLGRTTTDADVDRFHDVLPQALRAARAAFTA